jgi:hypothetical protein
LNAVLARTGGYDVYTLLMARMAEVSPEVTLERMALVTSFILRAVADRARAKSGRRGRPQLDQETFVRNLVAMAAASMSVPLT